MFSVRCRGRDDEEVPGKFGDHLKTANVESCIRDADICQRFHPRILIYHIRCIALLHSHSLVMIGWGNWS